jgi:hypothetical protein
MSNVLRIGDVRELNLYYPWADSRADEALWIPVQVKAFVKSFAGDESVCVEAIDRSYDHLVENEWTVPFRWLREPRPSDSGSSSSTEPESAERSSNPSRSSSVS